MKKLFAIAMLSFFASQVPAFSVWIGVCDYEKPDDNYPYTRTPTMHINVHFTKEKPNEDHHAADAEDFVMAPPMRKIEFNRINEEDAIENISNLFAYPQIYLDFVDIHNNRNIKLIKSVLREFPRSDVTPVVTRSFRNGTEQNIKANWEKLFKKFVVSLS